MFERLLSCNRVGSSAHLRTWLLGLCFLARVKSATYPCPWFTGCSAPARCTWPALWSKVPLRCSLWSGVLSVVQGVPQALLFFSGPDGGASSPGNLGQTVVLLLSLGLASESESPLHGPCCIIRFVPEAHRQRCWQWEVGEVSGMTVGSVHILGRTIRCPLLWV